MFFFFRAKKVKIKNKKVFLDLKVLNKSYVKDKKKF